MPVLVARDAPISTLSPSTISALPTPPPVALEEPVGIEFADAPLHERTYRPVQVVDPSNGQLAHWTGLNFSRGWMLHAIARALPENHPLIPELKQNGSDHIQAGLPLATHPDYMISHWVPTFAVYALTR